MGPAAASMLEAIDQTGSISGAGRNLGLSYRCSWLLVDAMNRCWREPLVETMIGSNKGARLTEMGRIVLASYRAMIQRMTCAAQEGDFLDLIALLRAEPLMPTAPSHPKSTKA